LLVKNFLRCYENESHDEARMSDHAEMPKRIGRPPKYPGEGKRPTLTFRVRGKLHEQLQAAAAASERSISEEIEARLEESFRREELPDLIKNAVRDAIAEGTGTATGTATATATGEAVPPKKRRKS
jgi:hypothetical protein